MDNRPYPLTDSEILELSAIEDICEMWGAQSPEEMADTLRGQVYGVRFDFTSGSPGYCGDLFVLYGDALQPPVNLIRNGGMLEVIQL